MEDLSDLDISADDAIGVWYDLERALAGTNGYGGDVAEIYAYRLVPKSLRDLRDKTDPSFITGATEAEEQAAKAELARIAGVNMTHLLRHFVELHKEIAISIEEHLEGFRQLDLDTEECPPFDWRIHLRVSQAAPHMATLPIHELRSVLAETVAHVGSLAAMIDELATYRAKDRLGAESREPAIADDLPPDAATGLYLDRPFDVEDLEWIKMAWAAFARGGSNAQRPSQLMLVFQAIRRDDRATVEFLRVMNTIVLPLCRRLSPSLDPRMNERKERDDGR